MKKKILLVDDEEDILDATKSLLEYDEGIEVCTAKNGLEATSVYLNEKPCLTFMDVRMPKMDGFEAFEKIRTLDENAKIILVSGFDYAVEKITDAKNKGLCCFQNKPIGIKTFEELIVKFD